MNAAPSCTVINEEEITTCDFGLIKDGLVEVLDAEWKILDMRLVLVSIAEYITEKPVPMQILCRPHIRGPGLAKSIKVFK